MKITEVKAHLSKRSHPFLLAVAGGSGSGKTTLAHALADTLGAQAAILTQDSYYIDQSHRFDGDGGSVNFDHPSSLDFALLAEHLLALRESRAVEQPIYDFATHKRASKTKRFHPTPLVIVDGTLILHELEVYSKFDNSVFVRASETVRFARRLERDVAERGRTPEGVHKQFHAQVKPMHDLFVEPSQVRANLTVSGEAPIEQALQAVLTRLF